MILTKTNALYKQIGMGLFLSLSSLIFIHPNLFAENGLKQLASDMMQLRLEVERLHDEVESQKDSYQSRLQSLNIQKADLSASLQRDELQVRQLTEQAAAINQQLSSKTIGSSGGIEDILAKQFTSLESYIQQSMPFKQKERLASLAATKKQFDQRTQSPYKIASLLWAFIEDELRLHRDIGLYKQVIAINGQEQLAEIVKLGMLTYYFKTADGQFGQARESAEDWQISLLTDSQSRQALENLFTAQKKNIRTGAFDLPKVM